MIALCRLRLINWHNFVNDLLNIQQITYLIGVNGVGKTTILDALRYCLTTNTAGLGTRQTAGSGRRPSPVQPQGAYCILCRRRISG